MDDCLISGATKSEHDTRLFEVLQILQNAGITLNKGKCEFGKQSVTFLGHVIGQGTIEADPKKVQAILEMPEPQNVSDVRRFLGLVNQLGKFSPNLAEYSKPIRDLLKHKSAWVWESPQKANCLQSYQNGT